jgi:RhtB (resistance to homoserine/threonine) family protein
MYQSLVSIDLHAVLIAGMLFFLGLISPGPNFLIVVANTLRGGQRSGFLTGLGATTGDAIYAVFGLLGFSKLAAQSEWLYQEMKLTGAIYLAFLGLQMMFRRSSALKRHGGHKVSGLWQCFFRGLATDLSNPKTIFFFSSIFAVTLRPNIADWAKATILIEIITISLFWRIALCRVFGNRRIRALYLKYAVTIERVFGALFLLIGYSFGSREPGNRNRILYLSQRYSMH